jgi:hypothetical protein
MWTGEAAAAALVALSVGADIVAVTGIRPPLRSIAEKIVRWRRNDPERDFSLLALSPRGQLRLDLDAEPDITAVQSLLETLYDDPSSSDSP